MKLQVPEGERWSTIFPAVGDEELIGTVVSHTRAGDKPMIRFDYDSGTTGVAVSDVIVVNEVTWGRIHKV